MASRPLTIFTLTELMPRGENFAFYAISSDQEILEGSIMCSTNKSCNHLLKKLKKSNYYVIHKYSLNSNQGESGTNYIRLYEDSSKIFQTGKCFEPNEEIIEGLFNPPSTTIPEALASPKKRKLSLEGTISEVFPMRTGKNWERVDFYLEDNRTKTKIQCKLWGKLAHKVTAEDTGNVAILKNVEVDAFNNKKHLKSIDLTTIQVEVASSSPSSEEYEILGVDENDNILTLITSSGVEFLASAEVLDASKISLQDFIKKTPLKAKLTTEDNTVTKIEVA